MLAESHACACAIYTTSVVVIMHYYTDYQRYQCTNAWQPTRPCWYDKLAPHKVAPDKLAPRIFFTHNISVLNCTEALKDIVTKIN